jgi:N-sulfoglucosamine sulfohydrolase
MIQHILSLLFLAVFIPVVSAAQDKPNILFISVDDMNCDSVGVYGSPLKDITPHMDQLASEGMRFEYAHVMVGNCYPGRNVMFSGRSSHSNLVEGFYAIRQPHYPHLVDLMKEGGYFTGIFGKESHTTPYYPYPWDLEMGEGVKKENHIKDAGSYYRMTAKGIAASEEADKPFCLLINISDPHLPFYRWSRRKEMEDPYIPSQLYTPEEIPVPGYLPDTPNVRKELAHYYMSVSRADDCLGETLRALTESGQADDTVVVFLSDHGMPFPLAKTCLYHHSTRTPWMVRWPGQIKPGIHDTEHMISALDLLPTLLDVAEIEYPNGLEGHSFYRVLKGEKQPELDHVIKEYNESSGRRRHPMRAVQSKQFNYIFNPWAAGGRKFQAAGQGTLTYQEMIAKAEMDPRTSKLLKQYDYRVVEEFFDIEIDPDNLNNLIDDPKFQDEIANHRAILDQWMEKTKDPIHTAFQNREDLRYLDGFVEAQQAQAFRRRDVERERNLK